MRLALTVVIWFALATSGYAVCHSYDALGRLTVSTYDSGAQLSFSLDPNGNRTQVQLTTGVTPTCPSPSTVWIGNGLAMLSPEEGAQTFAKLDPPAHEQRSDPAGEEAPASSGGNAATQ